MFQVVIVLVIFVLLVWKLLKKEKLPAWLLGLVIGAALLRIMFGWIWSVYLPIAGYQSPAEQKGYVMADAYNRDRAAWALADSNKSLWKGFQDYRKQDQYGGLLVLSAAVYRFAGGEVHDPLIMVMTAAVFSSLVILFAWGLARLAWGEAAANLAAWGLAIYPEAVLLGSSQMREAFLLTFVTAAFYGFLRYWKYRRWTELIWVIASLLLCLPFSPPLAGFLLFLLIVQGLVMGGGKIFHHRWIWFVVAGVTLLAIGGTWLTWKRLAPAGISNPLALIVWWLQKSSFLQIRTTRLDSGLIQEVFRNVPRWSRVYIIVAYGVVRPFLPASLADTTSAPIWRWISLWRSVGWTLLLPFMLYAPIRILHSVNLKKQLAEKAANGLCVVVWLGILVASLRAGADLWDNPRYRAMFAGLQICLAAWVWVDQRQNHDKFFRHLLVGVGLAIAWFIPWYLERYISFPWPVDDFFQTLWFWLGSLALYFAWVWIRRSSMRDKHRQQ